MAVVQIVKGLHEALGADVHDVWLTGFGSANIPFNPFPATAGRLDVRFRRGMRGEEGWQTLMMTSFESPNWRRRSAPRWPSSSNPKALIMSIEAIGKALPAKIQTAEDVAEATGADPAFVRGKVGLGQRHVLSPGETGLDLGEAAVRNLLEKSALEADQIDLLIYVTQTPDRRILHNAAPLAHRLGLSRGLASFDLALGCSGFVHALSVAESFLAGHGMSNAVIVTCDPYSRIMDSGDKATNVVFGDAAAATWIRRDGPTTRTLSIDFGTDGGGADAIRIDAGGAALPLVSLDTPEGIEAYEPVALRLHMEGRDVFNFVNATIPGSIKASLNKAGLTVDDIDAFALHQGSAYMVDALARRAGLPKDKLLMNIADYGNTVSSTVPLLLEPLLDAPAPETRRVLISGFGVGLSWATAVLELSPPEN
ncbi:3-oxoacyl-ACP synthase III family protein [Pseudooceanicola sp. 200-1SW]|uniref:3-oxoacyl-ACP synthase III family protein n=1 Tax=Pseudooceanicola sp. 200-1SW TaxID=3425949 RepID=UPI003D7FA20C